MEPLTIGKALRRDWKHNSEIAVLFTQPAIAGGVEPWRARFRAAHPSETDVEAAERSIRRSVLVARRAGVITGSSFYIGTPPAMAMIYCQQLLMVLRIAALFGRDPAEPARAAEWLVIHGKYKTLQDAYSALGSAGTPAPRSDTRRSLAAVAREGIGQAPAAIRKHGEAIKTRKPIDNVIRVVELVSMLVPVLSMPIWGIATARTTRDIGRKAVAYYSGNQTTHPPQAPLPVIRAMSTATRYLIAGVWFAVGAALAFRFATLHLRHSLHLLRWIGLLLLVLSLAIILGRLLVLTRARR